MYNVRQGVININRWWHIKGDDDLSGDGCGLQDAINTVLCTAFKGVNRNLNIRLQFRVCTILFESSCHYFHVRRCAFFK